MKVVSRRAMLVSGFVLSWLVVPATFAIQRPSVPRADGPVVGGHVRDASGKGIGRALVIARIEENGPPESLPVSAMADASGRFRLVVPGAARVGLRIQAEGFEPYVASRIIPADGMSVVLRPGATISGLVRDSGSREPLAGATVETWEESGAPSPPGFLPPEPSRRTTTDSAGRFKLTGLARVPHTVGVRAPRFGQSLRRNVQPGGSLELSVLPGATLSGTVRGSDKRPIAGASVVIDAEVQRFASAARPTTLTTDLQGNFEAFGLSAGTYRVFAHQKGFTPFVASGVRLEKSDERRIDVDLSVGRVLTGRLVRQGSEPSTTIPVPGKVSVHEVDGRLVGTVQLRLWTVEGGPNGRFRIEGVPAAPLALGIHSSGLISKRLDVTIPGNKQAHDLGDVLLDEGPSISGRVVNALREPVPNAYVFAFASRLVPTGARLAARTDADGRFTLSGSYEGPYSIEANAFGASSGPRATEGGASDVELVLTAPGRISGLVVDSNEKPVEGFRLAVTGHHSEQRRSRVYPGSAGRIQLDDLLEATYDIEVTAPGRPASTISDIVVTSGATTDVGVVRLKDGNLVRGVVVNTAGSPIAEAVVSVVQGYSPYRARLESVTDIWGAFEIRGLKPGTFDLAATHPDYPDGGVTGIQFEPEKDSTEARIVLGKGGRIEGRLHKRDGVGIAGARVRAFPAPQGMMISVVESLTALTDSDGRFVIDAVPPGRTRVTVEVGASGDLALNKRREVDVVADQTVTVDFSVLDIPVHGTVTLGNRPGSDLRVTLRGTYSGVNMFGESGAPPDNSRPARLSATTRADGAFDLLVDQVGPFSVLVESRDGMTRWPSRRVEIADDQNVRLDLDFPRIQVRGVVVDKDTEQPLGRAVVVATSKDPGAARSFTAAAGDDGAFSLELDPAKYDLTGTVGNYRGGPLEVDATESKDDVRLALEPASVIKGSVIDASGKGAGGVFVYATDATRTSHENPGAVSAEEGRFRLQGLARRPYNLAAVSESGAFGVLAGISPDNDEPVVLTLQRAGVVRLSVTDKDGKPVANALTRVRRVNGASYSWAGAGTPTDEAGNVEMRVPPGTVEVSIVAGQLAGVARVIVPPGGQASETAKLFLLPSKP